MAKSPYSVGFDISAKVNYSDINKANEAAGKLIEKLERLGKLPNGSGTAAGAISKQARTAANETEKLTNANRKLTDETKKAANAQSGLKDKVKQTANAGKSLDQTSRNVQTVGEHSKSAAGDMNILQRSIEKVKSIGKGAFEAVSEHVQRFGEHSEATRKKLDRLNETGKRFRDAGYSMLPVSAALGASFLKGAKDATQLQHRYTIIRNLIKTGGESTAASINNTRKMMSQGRDMSLKYGISQNDIAKGYETLVRRGYRSNQSLAAQKTYLQGSIASGDAYSDVVNHAASAIEQFGLKSTNTAKMTTNTKLAVNQMAYSADLTATSFKDLGEAMKYAGPNAHAANQTLHETVSAVGELSNFGIEGSQAGTSLRQIYTRLLNPPSKGKYVDAMKQLGLKGKDFMDSKNNLMSLQTIFDKINKRTAGMSKTQKGSVYSALFGQQASSAAVVLGEHTKALKGLDNEVQRAQKMDNGKGYVAGLSKKNMDSWQNQFKQFKASVDDLGMSFAKSVLPSVTPVVDKVTKLVQWFAKLPDPVKKVVAYGTAFVGIAGPLTIAVGSIASSIAKIGMAAPKVGRFITGADTFAGNYVKTKVSKKASPAYSVAQNFADNDSGLEQTAKRSGKEFAESASGGIKKGANTGGEKFSSSVKKGATSAGESGGKHFSYRLTKSSASAGDLGGKKFGSHVKSGTMTAANTGGKRFGYHIKSSATSGGVTGGKKFGHLVENAGVNAGDTGGHRFGGVMRGIGWAGFGAIMGASAFTSKSAKGRMHGAGEGIGAAVGGYLGGPAGAMVGQYIGGKIADTMYKSYKQQVKSNKHSTPTGGTGQSYGVRGNGDVFVPGVGYVGYHGDIAGSNSTKFSKAARTFHKSNTSHNAAHSGPYSTKLPTHATGGLIAQRQAALVGEAGPELAYTVNGRKARVLGAAGPQIAKVKPAERILNARDTQQVMGGGLGHVLPGYAAGTSTLGRTASNDKNVKSGLNKVVKDYDTTTKKSKQSLDKFSKSSKEAWNGVSKDTKSHSQKIQKNTVGDYDDLQKGSVKQLDQLESGNNSQWKSIQSQTGKRTNNLRKSTVSDFNDMQQGSQKQMNQLQSGVISAAKGTAVGFGKEMGRMKGYAHSAMGGAIGQLNHGISGIDSVLGQFGGNKSVINPIKYAAGSNGALTSDQFAMVNDADSGPRQEMIVRNNSLFLPRGKNRVLPLRKGDQVLNGSQTQAVGQAYGISHFAKGSGISSNALQKIADAGQKNPRKSFNNNFNVHVKVQGSQLQKGSTEMEKNASAKYGSPWMKAVWQVIEDQMGGAGGARNSFLKYAMAHFTGKPYLMGGLGPKNYDCSGMVYTALKHFGIDIGRTTVAMQQSSGVTKLGHKRSAVKQGDLIIYGHGGGAAGHVGIIDNPTKGTMFNETPPRARVTSIFPPMSMGYDYFRIKGLHDKDTDKSSNASSQLIKLVKQELGTKAIKSLQKQFADQAAGGGPVPKGDHMHWLEQAGMPRSWWAPISEIINRESNWQVHAQNGKYLGIPQTTAGNLAKAGSDWRSNPITQLRAMKMYIKSRYGTAGKALAFRRRAGWYANGGWAGKASIFGEVAGEPEVAINPKRNTADNLIGQTIDARAKVDKNSPSANFLKSVKSLKTKPSKAKIEPHITINFNGDISDEKTMNNAVDKMERKLTSLFQKLNDEFGLDDSVY